MTTERYRLIFIHEYLDNDGEEHQQDPDGLSPGVENKREHQKGDIFGPQASAQRVA